MACSFDYGVHIWLALQCCELFHILLPHIVPSVYAFFRIQHHS